jgi:hypothetical protein
LHELEAIARLVAGQEQATDELAAHPGQLRFVADAAGAVEQLEGDAGLAQHGDAAGSAVELPLRAKELQGAAAALVVGDVDSGAQGAQAITAVLGEADHPRLVDLVARCGAVAQHRQDPADESGIDMRPDDERPVVHGQPLDRLQRHARPGPWRRIAGRNLAGIGEARLERRHGLAIDTVTS